ncbi:uncharacterized protein ARMOST_09726 [Armillaria ostoyae]|uniref:Uncharacterized protein n=1 Tax=Armillaria ostoyae TaxID=47428 RepID=A0A284RCB1_ARMOS|nr:uncharacterized protein ARMOST_09726 [Armillaria ostoyae]
MWNQLYHLDANTPLSDSCPYSFYLLFLNTTISSQCFNGDRNHMTRHIPLFVRTSARAVYGAHACGSVETTIADVNTSSLENREIESRELEPVDATWSTRLSLTEPSNGRWFNYCFAPAPAPAAHENIRNFPLEINTPWENQAASKAQ